MNNIKSSDKRLTHTRVVIFSIVGLNALWIFLFWLQNNWTHASGSNSVLLSLADLMGLFLALSVLHQFLLQGRFPLFERNIGTVLIHRLHRFNGYLIFCLLLGHISIVTLANAGLNDTGLIKQFVYQVQYFPYVWLALIAAILLLVIMFSSIAIVRNRLRYEYWYFIHLCVYIVILTEFWHQFANGADLLSSEGFKYYWIALYVLILGSLLFYRFFLVVLRSFYYGFEVAKVIPEANRVVSIYIKTKRPLPDNFFVPGQFGIWRFFNRKLWWQSHPFTISAGSPAQGLRITPKAVGDYTTDLHEVKPGTKVFFDGPHGVFTIDRLENSRPVLIAGGIGVTPIRAMLEGLGTDAKGTVVIYSARSPQDLALKKELDKLAEASGARIYDIYQHIDIALLKNFLKTPKNIKVALCGPPGMMDAVEQTLIEFGIPKKRIFTERFAFTTR